MRGLAIVMRDCRRLALLFDALYLDGRDLRGAWHSASAAPGWSNCSSTRMRLSQTYVADGTSVKSRHLLELIAPAKKRYTSTQGLRQ